MAPNSLPVKATCSDAKKDINIASSSAHQSAILLPATGNKKLALGFKTNGSHPVARKECKIVLKRILRFLSDFETACFLEAILEGTEWTSKKAQLTLTGLYELSDAQIDQADFKSLAMNHIRNQDVKLNDEGEMPSLDISQWSKAVGKDLEPEEHCLSPILPPSSIPDTPKAQESKEDTFEMVLDEPAIKETPVELETEAETAPDAETDITMMFSPAQLAAIKFILQEAKN